MTTTNPNNTTILYNKGKQAMRTEIRRVYYFNEGQPDSYTESYPLLHPELNSHCDAFGVYLFNEDGTQDFIEDFPTLLGAIIFKESLHASK